MIINRLAAFIILTYYLSGILCLPQGDFSVLPDLPEMYRHCKATEDKDLTPLDFLTDHLVNIDGIFDPHMDGDDQKPHTPFQFHNVSLQISWIASTDIPALRHQSVQKDETIIYKETFYPIIYSNRIFRPPIVS